MAKNKEDKKLYKCCRCGTEYTTHGRNFNKVNGNSLYAGNDYRLHICKKCITQLVEKYLDEYENDKVRVIHRLCQLFDVFYSENLAKASRNVNKANNVFSSYITNLNLNQNQNKTYDDTLDEEVNSNTPSLSSNEESTYEVLPASKDFFGRGFSDADYDFLQKTFDDWTSRHECKTKTQEEIFKDIAMNRLKKLKLELSNTSTKEVDAAFMVLLDAGKLKPKQNDSESLSDGQTFGNLIKIWENEDPIPEIDEELRDVDNIGKYLDVFFRGHLAKMVNLKNAFSSLYEKFIRKYSVEKRVYDEDSVNEAIFNQLFGSDVDD